MYQNDITVGNIFKETEENHDNWLFSITVGCTEIELCW